MIGLPPVNAFVLQRTPYREQSYLLRLFTAAQGQVTAFYRGDDPLHLYQPYHMELHGTSDWQTVRHAELAGKVLRLSGANTYLALYLNELCGRLLPRWVPAEALMGTYYATLRSLQADLPIEPQLRYFERQLLAQLGYAIDFERDTRGELIQSAGHYRFDGVNAFIPVDDDHAGLLSGACIQAIGQNDYAEKQTLRAAKRVLRQALQHHLGDVPLQSRALFQTQGSDRGPSA